MPPRAQRSVGSSEAPNQNDARRTLRGGSALALDPPYSRTMPQRCTVARSSVPSTRAWSVKKSGDKWYVSPTACFDNKPTWSKPCASLYRNDGDRPQAGRRGADAPEAPVQALRQQWLMPVPWPRLARGHSCSATSGGSLSHHPEIMLGVLIPVLCLDSVATQRRVSREGQVPLIVPMCVAGRSILPLSRCTVLTRRPSSLRPRISLLHCTHSLDLP